MAAIVLAALVWQFALPLDGLLAWLIAINLVAFLTYGYDKAIAGSERTRVPEKVLLGLTIAGGTIGAFVGMRLFHHKTSKGRFRLRFWLIAVAQIVLVAVYYLLVKPRLVGG